MSTNVRATLAVAAITKTADVSQHKMKRFWDLTGCSNAQGSSPIAPFTELDTVKTRSRRQPAAREPSLGFSNRGIRALASRLTGKSPRCTLPMKIFLHLGEWMA